MKKLSIPLLAAFAAVLLSVTMSSFRSNDEKKPVIGNTYFKFDVNSLPSEANLETDAQWQVVTLPGSNPCNAGTAAPCIVHVDNTAAGINSGDDNATRITKFVDYLEARMPLASGASTFVSTSGNFDYQRQ